MSSPSPSASRRRRALVPLCALTLTLVAPTNTRADGLDLPPLTALPASPSAPHLWFDGADPAAIAALVARKTHPRTAAYYAAFKAYVDARLASLATADDDTRSKVAKAAALLHVLGDAPTAGPYATYRAAAVVAISGVGNRQAADSLADFTSPPPDLIHILQDSSRLQSLAEAYDLLRGSGVAPADDTAMRGRLANWAAAIAGDWNLLGAFGVPPHRDNWAIKGGAALMTVALAMPDHASADAWRQTAMTFIAESLTAVASATGWYRESVWYLNYSLANLWPTAWHLHHAAGLDWPAALRPFAEAALAWRQPDGRAPPFEEGLPNTFPFDAVASAYPDLAANLLWAWQESDQNPENFENQQIHDVTRFILADLDTAPAAPTTAPTRFLAGDTRLYALADGWHADALQVTGITAVDHSTSEVNASRHNMRNPLDLVVHGRGALVVPTASGGPQVTSSATRATYLSPLAKNIPLVSKSAPFITAASAVTFGDRLDSRDAGPADNHFADLARTTVASAYAAGSTVARAVALVDEGYVLVADRLALASTSELDLAWRGRGTRTTRASTSDLQALSWTSPSRPALDLDVVASVPLDLEDNPSLYADAWNAEEPIQGVLVGATAASAAFISIFQVDEASPRTVVPLGTSDAAAARVVDPGGLVEDLVIAPATPGFVTAGPLGTDGALALVRLVDDALAAFCLQAGAALVVDGAPLVTASAPTTMCATLQPDGGLVAEISADSPDRDLVIDLPADELGFTWQATLDGAALADPADFTAQADGLHFTSLGAGTLVLTAEAITAAPCDDAATRCDDDDACTLDGCVEATGACTHSDVTCPPARDALCAATVVCDPTTGCGFLDGPLAGADPDGLFCTVAERCDDGVLSVSARDCGEPDGLCATASVCDEASRSCQDSGAPDCSTHTVYATVLGPDGEVAGSIRCTFDGVDLRCDTDEDGTLIVLDEPYCAAAP